MFEKILFPTDFSDVSKKALAYIAKLKGAGTKEVVVLHVVDEREIESLSQHAARDFDIKEVEKRRDQYTKEQLKLIKDELKESGFKVKVRTERGIPFREILRVEEEEGVSVTVLGSHGKSLVKEMLLGSVSEKVIRKSSKPVLVIRR
jgi:nucleotide-binding universal stress UspA family protein